ncbi:hypothetical protein [Butyrivibrio sp. INlla16]|uniref:hypothetical protein n=1 Tax=Butyrivibrio sp. INlla16 TaxID=1520807 RepID=UPI00088E63E7|nr:hypothetical protein [Butyrivibrio sp. INlla16]SDB13332.1 hypothetical protein SAMN02910263_00608 [Butyrivibrio sp. INlla16]
MGNDLDNQREENPFEYDYEKLQRSYDEENEKAVPLCLIAVLIGLFALVQILSQNYIASALFLIVGLLFSLIIWGVFSKSSFARKVALTYIVAIVIGIIIIISIVAGFLSDVWNFDGLPF